MPDLFEGTNLVPVGVDHRVQTLAGAALTVDVGAGRAGGPWTVVGFGVAAHGTVGLERRQGNRMLRQAAVDLEPIGQSAYSRRPYSPSSSRLRADHPSSKPGAFLAYDHPEDAPAGSSVFRYRPQTGFVGIDYFWFEIENPGQSRALGWVEIRVRGVNRPPVAAGQLVIIDRNGVEADGPVTIDVLAAASDPDGDRLRITDLTLPAHGLLALNADQTLTYTPLTSFTEHDSFGYRIRDLRAAGDSQVGHAEAQVTLRRPPVVVPPNIAPIAGRDRATTTKSTPVVIPILANDFERFHDDRMLPQAAVDRCSRRSTTLRADRLAFLAFGHPGGAQDPNQTLEEVTGPAVAPSSPVVCATTTRRPRSRPGRP